MMNCRSMCNKINDIESKILEEEPDILCLVETWLNESYFDGELIPKDYILYRKDRGNRGGGVAIAIKRDMISNEIEINNNETEAIWVEIKNKSKKCIIGCVYRPENDKECFGNISNMMKNIKELGVTGDYLIAGDFNLRNVGWGVIEDGAETGVSKDMEEWMTNNGMEQIVREITRPSESPSVLDLIFTNRPEKIMEIKTKPGISDHNSIILSYDIECSTPETKKRQIKNYNKADLQKSSYTMGKKWEKYKIDTEGQNIEQKWKIFKEDLRQTIEKTVPNYEQKKFKTQWMSEEIRRLIRRRNRAYKTASKIGTKESMERYVNLGNIIKNKIKNSKQRELQSITDKMKKDPKQFWRFIKTKKTFRTNIPPLYKDQSNTNKVITENKEKAETFNEYFYTVFEDPDDDTKTSFEPRTDKKMEDINFSVEGIISIIKNLKKNKSAGPDDITAEMLQITLPWSAHYLQDIFSTSYNEGKLPREWKEAIVVPIHKKGKKSEVSNYRPISLTSVPCRVMEHILVSNIYQHLEKEDLLTNRQFGFRKAASTELMLIDLIDKITRLKEKYKRVDIM